MNLRIVCGKCGKLHKLRIKKYPGRKKFSCRLKANWSMEGEDAGSVNFTRKRDEECRIYKLDSGPDWLDVSVAVTRWRVWS